MAERSFPFDAELVDGKYDRVYMSEIFRKYFFSFVSNGVFAGKGNNLMVTSRLPEVMQVVIKSGQAFTEGAFYDNDDDLILSVASSDNILNRIDAVVVQCDYVQRQVTAKVITGTPAQNPLHYTPVRNADKFELLLAEIYVPFTSTAVKQANITDYRANNAVCGWVTGYLQQIDATSFFNQYQLAYEQFMNEAKEGFGAQITTINDWFSNVKDDIALLQYFSFDNLAVLPNCRYQAVDEATLPSGYYMKGFVETITNISTGKLIAKRLTQYPTNMLITIQTIRYALDGTTELDNTIQTINIGAGDTVDITGTVQNEYKPAQGS